MLALVFMYPPHNTTLFEKSEHTLCVCLHPSTNSLHIINVKDILLVVAMVPMPRHTWIGGKPTIFVVEKLGLDISHMGGAKEIA